MKPRYNPFFRHSLAIAATLALGAGTPVFAASATWNGTTNAVWATGTNWSLTPVPGTGDTATFNNAGGAVDVIDLGAGVTIRNIVFDTANVAAYTIGSGTVGSQTLTLNNGGAITANNTISADQLFNANLVLGTDATTQSYTITNSDTGSLLNFAGGISGGTTGTAGAKTLNISAATGGGTLSGNISNGGATSLAITKTGAGALTLSGTNTHTGITTINGGTLVLSGGSAIANTARVQLANTTGVALQLNNSETIGELTGGGTNGGNVDLGGNTLTVNPATNAGPNYTGVISNGSLTLNGATTASFQLSGANTYNGDTVISAGRLRLSAAAAALSASSLIKAEGGQFFTNKVATFANNFQISGSGFVETDGSQLGAIRGDNATFNTGTITLTGAARIGVGAGAAPVTGTYDGKITGNYALDFYAANQANSSVGTFVLSNTGNDWGGETTISNRDLNIAVNNGGNPYTGSSTTLKLGASGVLPNGTGKGILTFTGADTDHKSILEMNGFNETINGLSVTGSAAGAIIQNSSGSSTLTIGDADTTSSFSGTIKDNGATLAITKIGSGTLTLSGTSTYSGGTLVSAGTLLVNGSITSSVSVDSGATLSGTGTVGATSINGGGILTPGDGGIESLNVSGTLALNSTSFSNFQINATSSTSDLVAATAAIAFGGTLNVTNIAGALTNGQTFNLFDWVGTSSGAFALLNLPSLDPNLSWDSSLLYSNGTMTVIPEPRAALLGGLGLLALLRRRRA